MDFPTVFDFKFGDKIAVAVCVLVSSIVEFKLFSVVGCLFCSLPEFSTK